MKRLLLLLLLSLGLVGLSNAVSSVDDYYTALCVTEKSTGFNWEDNNWKQYNFTQSKYVVKKLNPAEVLEIQCSDTKDRNNDSYYSGFDEFNTYGCYSIKRLGYDGFDGKQDCAERWSTYPKQDGEKYPKMKKLEKVWCSLLNDFKFSPNGWFHKNAAVNSSSLESSSKYKDSLVLSVGKCSTI